MTKERALSKISNIFTNDNNIKNQILVLCDKTISLSTNLPKCHYFFSKKFNNEEYQIFVEKQILLIENFKEINNLIKQYDNIEYGEKITQVVKFISKVKGCQF